MYGKKIIPCFIFILIFLFAVDAAAHRLNVFAWLDNDKIIVRANFGEKHPAMNAAVNVLDSETHDILLHGATGEDGQFSFPVPSVISRGHGLIIEVNAGQGHKGQWSMEASELYSAASLAAGFEEARIKSGESPAQDRPVTIAPPTPAGISAEQMQSIVMEAVAPLQEKLAAMSARGPGVAEIVGGIGWIIGLVGIGLYFKSRSR